MLRRVKIDLRTFYLHRQERRDIRFLCGECDTIVLRGHTVRRHHMNGRDTIYATFCHRDDLTTRSGNRYDCRCLQGMTRQRIGVIEEVGTERCIGFTVYIESCQQRIRRSGEGVFREGRDIRLCRREETDSIVIRRALLGCHHDTCRSVTRGGHNRDGLSRLTQDGDLRHRSRGPGERVVQGLGIKTLHFRPIQIDHLQVSVFGFLHLEIEDIHPCRTVSGSHRQTGRHEGRIEGAGHCLVRIPGGPTDRRHGGCTGR